MTLRKTHIHELAKELLPVCPGYNIYDKEYILYETDIAIQGICFNRSSFRNDFSVWIFADVLSIPKEHGVNDFVLQGDEIRNAKHYNNAKWYSWSDNIKSLAKEIEIDIRSSYPELFDAIDDEKVLYFLTKRFILGGKNGYNYYFSLGHLYIKLGKYRRGKSYIKRGIADVKNYARTNPELVKMLVDDAKQLLALPDEKKIEHLMDNVKKTKKAFKMA